MTATAERVLFDRLNPEPPEYLHRLRVWGHWRRYHAQSSYWRGEVRSKAFIQAFRYMPPMPKLFVDAGCGESPDAGLAVNRCHFAKAVKVDLWEPYVTSWSSWAADLKAFEGRNVRFVKGDICKLSDYIKPGTADLVSSHAVVDLMNAADRQLFYDEAWTVLRPGGILSVTYVHLVNGYHDWRHGRQEFAGWEWGFDPLSLGSEGFVLEKLAVTP